MNTRMVLTVSWAAMLIGIESVYGADAYPRRTAIVEAIAKTRSAIVSLSTLQIIPARFEDQEGGRIRGLGTGVIIDPRGYIVTNYHVVLKVDEIQAHMHDGKKFPARRICFDDRADLAILKIDSNREFDYLPLWGAGDPILGETVIAIGNPYGLEGTVSTGIISAVGRELKLPNDEVFQNLIQTDAGINPGNSGGPLLNINGDLLGINIAIRSNAQNIGFAVPTGHVRWIVDKLMTRQNTVVAQQGLYIEEVNIREKPEAGDRARPVVRVTHVEPDSAAFRQGFRAGDELLAVGRQPVRLQFDVARIFWDRKYDESMVVLVRRDGQQVPIKFTLQAPKELSDAELLWQHVGIEVQTVAAERVRKVHSSLNGGLLVLRVAPGSIADKSDIRPGDILIGLDEWATVESGNVRWVMQWKDLPQRQPISYQVIREGRRATGSIRLPYLHEAAENSNSARTASATR